jgi:membrane protease YdiL (CAAX protease family)
MTTQENASQSYVTAGRDIILILGTLFITKALILNIDALWSYAGPISLLTALGMTRVCLVFNQQKWADIGLKRPDSIIKILLWTVLILVLTTLLGALIEGVVASAIPPVDSAVSTINERYQNRFAAVPGNLPAYLFWLGIAWVIGGFTEEVLFRGMLISRFEKLFSFAPFGIFLAVIMQAIIFGQQHFYYQGLNGALATGAIALVSGLFYLLLKRNLWPLMLSHGLANTLGLTLIYLGKVAPA